MRSGVAAYGAIAGGYPLVLARGVIHRPLSLNTYCRINSGSVPELLRNEAGNQLVDQLRRLDMRRMPDPRERAVFGARECRGERLAARLRRDDVLAAAGHQHLLREAPRIHRETALRKAMRRLPVAL